jgi:signal peptidase I
MTLRPKFSFARFLAVVAGIVTTFAAVRLGGISGLFVPVRITGASMAETLRGAHYLLSCDDCGFPCRYDADRPPTDDRAVCPNCGDVMHSLGRAVLRPGQRVLIDRLAYQFRPPCRGDRIAFRSSQDPDYFEVKRVAGLPGERISIRQGDIYADDRIVRKTLRQLRDVAVLVHDSGFEPRQTVDLPARWRADAAATAGGAAWSYHHWRCFASPLPRSAASPVLDNYGYNQNESRQLHVVRDLLLACRLRTSGHGTLQLRLADGQDSFRADMALETHQANVYRNERRLVTAPLPRAAWARDVKLEFALCDRQVLLAVDGQTVVCEPYEAPALATGGNPCAARDDEVGRGFVRSSSGEAELVRQQGQAVTIGASGMSLDLHRLQVFRDLHYLDPQGLGLDWIAPAKLEPDEVLVLGDNVPVSRDSRHSHPAAVPRTRWLGRVVTLP